MNKKLKLIVIVGILAFQPLSVFAQGSSGSHGGDSRCQEFYQIASEISVELAKMGQVTVDQTDRLINVGLVRDQVQRPLVVTPGYHLSRQALSDPSLDTTLLDVEQWDGLKSRAEKIKLVAHELMVLTNVESDGEYSISKDVIALLKTTKKFPDLNYSNLGKYKLESDGSITLDTPRYNDALISEKSSPRGVCVSFGFDENVSVVYGKGWIIGTWLSIISAEGHYIGGFEAKAPLIYIFDETSSPSKFIISITCK